jgi:hypothetical protein
MKRDKKQLYSFKIVELFSNVYAKLFTNPIFQ